MIPFMNPDVALVIKNYPAAIKPYIIQLRALTFKVGNSEGIADLQECLKWGDPSYTSKRGSTLHLGFTLNLVLFHRF